MQDFGIFWSAWVGIFFTGQMIIKVTNIEFRGIAIKKAVGWSFKLIGAILHITTDAILHNQWAKIEKGQQT